MGVGSGRRDVLSQGGTPRNPLSSQTHQKQPNHCSVKEVNNNNNSTVIEDNFLGRSGTFVFGHRILWSQVSGVKRLFS